MTTRKGQSQKRKTQKNKRS